MNVEFLPVFKLFFDVIHQSFSFPHVDLVHILLDFPGMFIFVSLEGEQNFIC